MAAALAAAEEGLDVKELFLLAEALGADEVFGNLKLPDLKSYCKRFGLKPIGCKSDIVTSLVDYVKGWGNSGSSSSGPGDDASKDESSESTPKADKSVAFLALSPGTVIMTAPRVKHSKRKIATPRKLPAAVKRSKSDLDDIVVAPAVEPVDAVAVAQIEDAASPRVADGDAIREPAVKSVSASEVGPPSGTSLWMSALGALDDAGEEDVSVADDDAITEPAVKSVSAPKVRPPSGTTSLWMSALGALDDAGEDDASEPGSAAASGTVNNIVKAVVVAPKAKGRPRRATISVPLVAPAEDSPQPPALPRIVEGESVATLGTLDDAVEPESAATPDVVGDAVEVQSAATLGTVESKPGSSSSSSSSSSLMGVEELFLLVQALGAEEVLGNYKITELKSYCKHFGLTPIGCKADLVASLAEHVQNAGNSASNSNAMTSPSNKGACESPPPPDAPSAFVALSPGTVIMTPQGNKAKRKTAAAQDCGRRKLPATSKRAKVALVSDMLMPDAVDSRSPLVSEASAVADDAGDARIADVLVAAAAKAALKEKAEFEAMRAKEAAKAEAKYENDLKKYEEWKAKDEADMQAAIAQISEMEDRSTVAVAEDAGDARIAVVLRADEDASEAESASADAAAEARIAAALKAADDAADADSAVVSGIVERLGSSSSAFVESVGAGSLGLTCSHVDQDLLEDEDGDGWVDAEETFGGGQPPVSMAKYLEVSSLTSREMAKQVAEMNELCHGLPDDSDGETATGEAISIEVRLAFSGLLVKQVELRSGASVKELKRIVAAAKAWPPGAQQLFLGAKALEASKSLAEVGLRDGSVVTVACTSLRWHDKVIGPHVELSEDGLTVSRREKHKFNNAVAIANGPIRAFRFEVLDNSACFGGGVEIGFSMLAPDALIDGIPASASALRQAFVCDGYGELHEYTKAFHALDIDYGEQAWDPEKLRSGDVVACRVTETGRMQIDINGKKVANWDARIPSDVDLYPVVSLFGKMKALKMLKSGGLVRSDSLGGA